MATRLYGDSASGNCLKVKWVLDRLRQSYEWVETSAVRAETRLPGFLAINPWGQVPAAILSDGRRLTQSGALMLYFAEGSDLIPADPYERARMFEWMFWEQYSHEPCIAVRRFQLAYMGRKPEELDPRLLERGNAALAFMEAELSGREWLVGERLSLADIALVAYTRCAREGGFELGAYPTVEAWIARVEAELGIGAYADVEAQPSVA